MWSKHPEYANLVAESWNQDVQGTKMFKVAAKLKRLKAVFKQLNKTQFADLLAAAERAKIHLQDRQNALQQQPFDENLQMYKGYEETLTHALWSCERARNIWKLFSWYEFEDTIKVMWAIWENRNRKWQQLPSMNAVVDKVAGMGLGYIWRKTDGQILAAGQIYRNGICSAKMAEAWAILEALKNPPAEVTNPIEVQTDCRVLVEEINNKDQHHSAESNLLHKIHNVLANFQNVKIIHVKRTNNECANMLAGKCLVDKNTQFFNHSFPDWLANFCKADYPHVV
ncbi:hypothetical protein G4B88_020111 [Cannabis sativa]|uniref:RNase H type-1 domain-containing protein n=1 Tax=Cannabis sativa TaxID=3483 RepID=A0A7J6GNV9_CANSA|nr:hypothetical protein G4B88_020111 [Cannabis sativa]